MFIMKHLLASIIFFIVFSNAYNQNYYVPKYKITSIRDSTYINLQKEKENLNLEFLHFIDNILHKNTEVESINNLIFKIKKGYEGEVIKTVQTDSIIKSILARNNLSPTTLLNYTKRFQSIIYHESWFQNIGHAKKCSKRKHDIPWKKTREFKKYKIKNGDKILEIGSGTLHFGYIIGRKRKNCRIYLNDTYKNALDLMYIGINIDNGVLSKNINKRKNEYFLVQGSETSTGAENIIFDKIIIRNAFQCFYHKKEMLESIKKSMDENTILIIKDRFIKKETTDTSDYPANALEDCPDLYKKEFEDILSENGFVNIYSKRLKTKLGKNYWLYKFKKR